MGASKLSTESPNCPAQKRKTPGLRVFKVFTTASLKAVELDGSELVCVRLTSSSRKLSAPTVLNLRPTDPDAMPVLTSAALNGKVYTAQLSVRFTTWYR